MPRAQKGSRCQSSNSTEVTFWEEVLLLSLCEAPLHSVGFAFSRADACRLTLLKLFGGDLCQQACWRALKAMADGGRCMMLYVCQRQPV